MEIGIIGTGWGARVQVPAFRAAGLRIAGIAGRDPKKTAREAESLGVQAYNSWEELLAGPATLISIVTPPALHEEMALAALAAGKHVLCEKPMALATAQAARMAAVAAERPAQLALIDHELRFLPVWQEARAMIAQGSIGTPWHVTSTITAPSRADRQRAWDWWSDKEQGGGVWGAIGSHQLDMLAFLLGPVAAVQATLATIIDERPYGDAARPVTSDDHAVAQVRLESGVLASLVLTTVAARAEPDTMVVHGSGGALRISAGRLEHSERNGEWIDRTPPHTVAIPEDIKGMFPIGTIYLGQALGAWAAGDVGALSPAATFADGVNVQRALDAGYRSAETGAWEPLADA